MPVQRRTVTISSTTSTARSPVTIVRFLAAIFACVTFSLIAHTNVWSGTIGDLCMFCWCFCFAVTIVILVVEFAGLQSRMPVSWRNFPITFAMFAVLMCLSATIIYPTHFLFPKGYSSEIRTYQIVAIVFSSLTTLAYIIEVSLTRAKPGEVTGYMATVPGLLKVVETYVAIIIFVFISDPPQYTQYEALKWCLAVYCICFILSVVIIILCIGECTGWLPCAFNKFLSGYALLAVLLYASAMIIWPIYHFDSRYGNTKKTSGCSDIRALCVYDRRVGIAVLTAINLLAYILDLIFSARLVFITTTSI